MAGSRLEGSRVFITGAGQGIGRAIAIAAAREGAIVHATSRTAEKLSDLPTLVPGVTTARLDVTDGSALEAAIAAAGEVDVLVNAAGWVHAGTILECSPEDWAASFERNATPVYRSIRAVLPGMITRGRGAIVNIASVASSLSGVARRAAYGASKAAVIGLTKAVARDCAGTGVRCNALCPGTTDTPSLQERIAATGDPERARQAMIARHPVGRLATAEEIAAAAIFLACSDSGFMTGSVLVMDGGQTL